MACTICGDLSAITICPRCVLEFACSDHALVTDDFILDGDDLNVYVPSTQWDDELAPELLEAW